MSMGNSPLAIRDAAADFNQPALNDETRDNYRGCESSNPNGEVNAEFHSNGVEDAEQHELLHVTEPIYLANDARINEDSNDDRPNLDSIGEENIIEIAEERGEDIMFGRDAHDESRPPPLQLDSHNAELPIGSLVDGSDLHVNRGSLDSLNGVSSSRGAHVDVSVFRYQPGILSLPENIQSYRINLKGAALTGNTAHESLTAQNIHTHIDMVSEYERLKGSTIERHFIRDHRAKQLLIVPTEEKFVAVAAPEAFSRHSGTCMILGGQGAYSSNQNKSYELKVGSFLRIGSVGVVVSEINTGPGGIHKSLTWEELTCLKGDIAAIQRDFVQLEALTAQEERELSPEDSCERKMCYICFDDIDEPSNPLVAPCNCKGDTRYLHLNCLQKWHSTASENKVCIVLNSKGVRVCSICMSSYRSTVRLPSGDSISLLQSPLSPPYICFMVVTKHLNNEDLFSTKYQLSFSSVLNRSGTSSTRGLIVGRSRQCDMVLDYRTVSTRHASIKFSNGGFYYSDLMSSNGSYLYLREPLVLPYGENVYLKWGSSVVSLKAKRSLRHRLNTLVNRRVPRNGTPVGAMDMSMLESLCEMGQNPTESVVLPGGEENMAS